MVGFFVTDASARNGGLFSNNLRKKSYLVTEGFENDIVFSKLLSFFRKLVIA